MRKITLFILLLAGGLNFLLYPQETKEMPELKRPFRFCFDESRLYILDEEAIYIYSYPEFRYKKKFSRIGEGPGEFQNCLGIFRLDNHLIVDATGKVMFYTRDGEFKREVKKRSGPFVMLHPLKDGYVGFGPSVRSNKGELFRTLNFFDSRLNKGNEIHRWLHSWRKNGKCHVLDRPLLCETYKNKIIIAGSKGFNISILDHQGKTLLDLSRDYRRKPFTRSDRKKYREFNRKMGFGQIEKVTVYADFFPELNGLSVDDGKIYLYTYKERQGKREFFIFDMKGKLLKQTCAPLQGNLDALNLFSLRIKNGVLYQLVDNAEEEVWELHITPLQPAPVP
ncbi:MAG: 6-bladed beta-propeller [bacterium]|nr:6-bladed beta-propeller [bacterium]